MIDKSYDVAIIGAGITGCFAGYYLGRSGLKVLVIDPDEIGRHASGNNSGGINPLHGPGIPGPMADFARRSYDLHVQFWDDIADKTGIDFAGRIGSRIHLAFEEDESVEFQKIIDCHENQPGFSAKFINREDLLSLEPRLNPALLSGVITSGSAVVDGSQYCRAVAQAATESGATFLNKRATDIKGNRSTITQVSLEHRHVDCDSLLICAGPWSKEIGSWLGANIPVNPLKGELLKVSSIHPPFEHDFTWGGVAVYPQADGQTILGGTQEDIGFNEQISNSAKTHIIDGILRIMPGLGNFKIEKQIVGLRPMSIDGFPLVGLIPGWRNAYVATGGGQKGMLYATGLAKAISDLLTKGKSPLPIKACNPDRFKFSEN